MNPFEEMEAVQNRLSSFFGWTPVRDGYHAPIENQWAPLIDVIETGDEYLIRADLPGVTRNDFSVTLERGELVIKGTRPAEQLAKGAHYMFNERPSGSFTRTFEMPSHADAARIQAEFKDGVLTIHVGKDEKAKPRAITVQTE
jgi:HSP20 family protein